MEEKYRIPEDKYQRLEEILQGYGSLAVAFSGGVDSAFLLAFAWELLPGRVLALTAEAPAFPAWEQEEAVEFCRERGIPQVRVALEWGDLAGFAENPPDRCYLCKRSIFTILKKKAEAEGFSVLADGTNGADVLDYRPGMRALAELGIVSPLKEAGLTKEDIRPWLRRRGISLWDKPSCACLASRIPYGEPITAEKLQAVDAVERFLRGRGFAQVRVRCHGAVARIEVEPAERRRFLLEEDLMELTEKAAKAAGFSFAALDLGGYRMGSLNPAEAESGAAGGRGMGPGQAAEGEETALKGCGGGL
ncbi:MAG: ATP-dependent sacrificial sulfur transferase LarE [Bacillota bacterium]|nr:ATP-dependent sacrificial sulfur transferase LarE [Bacillota bacterium]